MKFTLLIAMYLLKFGDSTTPNIIKKAVFIANKEYKEYHVTSVVWRHCDQEYVIDFLTQFRGTVVTIKITDDFGLNNTAFHKKVRYEQTVFFATDAAEFEYFLQMINNAIVVSIKVVVVIASHDLSQNSYIDYTKIAWKNGVSDIVLVCNDVNNTVTLKTYIPYGTGVCGDFTPIHLNPNNTKYFKRKFQNFNGCPIKVTILEFIPYVKLTIVNGTVVAIGGIDGNVLKLLIERLNASMDIVSVSDHGGISTCINGTRAGSFSDLVYGVADIMAPAIIIVSLRYPVSQISHVYYTVKVGWCLPNRREIYKWAKAILPFLNLSTPLIMLAFLIILIILSLVKRFGKFRDEFNSGTSFGTFHMIGIFFGQTVNIYSKYWLVNAMFAFWIWFCLIVRISYQGNLIDGLRKSILEPSINSLAEAIEVVDEAGGMPTFLEFYRNTSVEQKYKGLKLSQLPIYMKEVAAGRRFLLAIDTLQLSYYQQQLQILDERVTSLPTCIHMRPRWPAAPEIARLISRTVESGFIAKIWSDMNNEWQLANGTENFEPLKIETLSSCFYGLVIMYFVSFFVFCIEIILGRYKKYKKTFKSFY